MATATTEPYVLGVNQQELERLGFQHRIWAGAAHALWERAGLRPGARVLDLGCGPGFTSLDLAQLVGAAGRVEALDEAAMYVEWLRRQAAARDLPVGARAGDVQDLAAAGFREPAFDLVYARWVLCFVPDPAKVIAGAARVLRPGGALVIQDYLHYSVMSLAPASPTFDRVVAAVTGSWRGRGGDPDVVRRVPRMLHDHGLALVHIQPHLLAARPGTLLWEWPASFFRNFVPQLEAKGLLAPGDARAFEADWQRACDDPSTVLYTPPLVDLIARRP
jgi:SAM-dependent methyltransferase